MAEGFFGEEGCGDHPRPAMASRPGWPPPPKPGPPPPRLPGESGLDPPFFDVAGASKDLGAGEVGMGGRGRGRSSTWTSPCGRGGPKVVGVATAVAREETGGDTPPTEKGVMMIELTQLNLFTPEVKKGGGQPLAIHPHVLAGTGTWGDRVCGEEVDLHADLVGAHGDGGCSTRRRPTGGRMPDWCKASPLAQVQAQVRRNPRNRGPPAAAPPQPPRRLRQGSGGHLPRPRAARHGLLTAF